MVISSRRAGASRLCNAIDAYRAEQKGKLDKPALGLLGRLADSSEAAKAFDRLKLKDRRDEERILRACIKAEQLARTFPARILAEQKTPARLKGLDKAVAELRAFDVEETKQLPPGDDLLSPWFDFDDGRRVVGEITSGLDFIAEVIERRRRFVNSIPSRLGATRDKYHKGAANSAAIWSLALAVYAALGKPHRREVTDLAQAILGTDVTIEQVDHVVRIRRQRWTTLQL